MKKETITIGLKLKKARQTLDLTLKDVGEAIGISPQAVQYLERKSEAKIIDYIQFLRKNGIDLNKIFEE